MMNDEMKDYNYCYECGGYGDDYRIDDDGQLVCNCDECPYNDEIEERMNEHDER